MNVQVTYNTPNTHYNIYKISSGTLITADVAKVRNTQPLLMNGVTTNDSTLKYLQNRRHILYKLFEGHGKIITGQTYSRHLKIPSHCWTVFKSYRVKSNKDT